MKFCTVTPTRDRPRCFAHCKEQLDRQTLQPDARYYIAYEPTSGEMDLVKRVKSGVALAKRDGIDLVFIVEDDDAYPNDYFERFAPFFNRYEFFGDDHSTYYSVKTQRYSTWHHPNRASLFTTGFKISALNTFNWPPDNERFLDIKLWQFAKSGKKKFIDSGAVGIKGHGEGKMGGKGHVMKLENFDSDWSFLKSKVNGSLNYYQNL